MITLVLLSLPLYYFAIRLFRNQSVIKGLKANLAALALGFITFNTMLGLLKLFDGLEADPDHPLQTIVFQSPILVACLVNALFFGTFTVLLMLRCQTPGSGKGSSGNQLFITK